MVKLGNYSYFINKKTNDRRAIDTCIHWIVASLVDSLIRCLVRRFVDWLATSIRAPSNGPTNHWINESTKVTINWLLLRLAIRLFADWFAVPYIRRCTGRICHLYHFSAPTGVFALPILSVCAHYRCPHFNHFRDHNAFTILTLIPICGTTGFSHASVLPF